MDRAIAARVDTGPFAGVRGWWIRAPAIVPRTIQELSAIWG